MSPVVVDMDVASFLFKGDTRASGYRRHLENRQWTISFMTEAELEQWAFLANWQAKRIEWLRTHLKQFVIIPTSRDLVL